LQRAYKIPMEKKYRCARRYEVQCGQNLNWYNCWLLVPRWYPVLRNRKYFFRIRISGAVILTYDTDPGGLLLTVRIRPDPDPPYQDIFVPNESKYVVR
jgi:hypothetical protein